MMNDLFGDDILEVPQLNSEDNKEIFDSSKNGENSHVSDSKKSLKNSQKEQSMKLNGDKTGGENHAKKQTNGKRDLESETTSTKKKKAPSNGKLNKPSSFSKPEGLSNLISFGDEDDTQDTNTKNKKPSDLNIQTNGSSSISKSHKFIGTGSFPHTVFIEEASKASSGQGSATKYVLYTIKYGEDTVKRRYSDFELLRKILVKLFPTTLIPPIPKKQGLKSYSQTITSTDRYKKTHTSYLLPVQEETNGIDLSHSVIRCGVKDEKLIRHRIRLLTSFLNRLLNMDEITKTNIIFDFLDPDQQNYVDLINGLPSISNNLLTTSIYQLNPSNPLCTDMKIYSVLPIPHKQKTAGEASTSFISDASKTLQHLYLSSSPSSSSTSLITPPTSDEDMNANIGVSASGHINSTEPLFENEEEQQQQQQQQQQRNQAHQTSNPDFKDFDENMHNPLSSVLDQHFNKYEHILKLQIFKYNKKSIQHLKELQLEYASLSQLWGDFSGTSTYTRSSILLSAMFDTSTAFEESHLNMEILAGTLYYNISEPLYELCGLAQSAQKLIEYRNLKKTQKNMVAHLISSKKQQLEKLKLKQKTKTPNNTLDSNQQQQQQQQQQTAKPQAPSNESTRQSSFYGNRLFKRWNQITTIVKETINYVEVDPEELIPKLENEIETLQSASRIAQQDLVEIESHINLVELPKFSRTMDTEIQILLKEYAKYMKEAASKNLKYWKAVKNDIQN
ncbi:hypothetical protein ACO0RG_001259 [Hanseniaspora osmophila]